jgi:hypothetical protein
MAMVKILKVGGSTKGTYGRSLGFRFCFGVETGWFGLWFRSSVTPTTCHRVFRLSLRLDGRSQAWGTPLKQGKRA